MSLLNNNYHRHCWGTAKERKGREKGHQLGGFIVFVVKPLCQYDVPVKGTLDWLESTVTIILNQYLKKVFSALKTNDW